ncbi:type IV pilus biogenesis/stability protein PilW [Colwellia sp. 1_MG-2023]|uniref:type IV pilus biogenesis/stability protein PilW n=1 Tax=Colwellia sp. 1_MG-2023 TaxID=3062649 RepID=UPI0026E1D33C|nr:type IV pilus biogenesis/stability protein PilW [Colwellia sp. 1_MG-2023]MDO6446565.1 type IV pilus biogenesis/stability protein PilW [Colwellia sp. 1_MG-2023]
MDKYLKFLVSLSVMIVVTGCVTQNYENDKSTPVIENESTNNEIAMTRISLGLGYLKMGNTTQAKLNLEKAKRFAPKLVQVHTAFAHYFDSVGEPEQAIASYEKALSIKPDDADTLNNYGVFLCKQQRYQDAEKQILKAIAQPSYILVSQSYENLALCQLKAQAFDKAELYFDKAILHSPSSASSLLHMVRLQYAKADYKKALVFLKRYEKATRRFSANALALAFKIFEKQRDLKTAKNYASMLVKMFPNSYEAKQYLLTGLREIEADQLAREYQDSLSGQKKSKKRVVVLSPSKSKSSNTASKNNNNHTKTARKLKDKNTVEKQQNVSKASQQINPKTQQVDDLPPGSVASDVKAKDKITPNQQMVSLPIHLVVKGDSLFSISKKYNIHMKAIMRWNKMTRTSVLKIGDVIYLANPKKIAKPEEQ